MPVMTKKFSIRPNGPETGEHVMILTLLQARISSSRLPGKVLKPILGEPMLFRQIERIRRARAFDKLLLATSGDSSDDPLAAMCASHGVACFRGSLHDVLDRFYSAARQQMPQHVVRLTGDCPLADPELIDKVIAFHLDGDFDYSSNTLEPTFPDGLDVEVFRFSCLETAWKVATLPSQREHVTPFMHQQPDLFRLGSFKQVKDLSGLRWTVDEPEDFELVKRIYEELYPVRQDFTTSDILALLEKKRTFTAINAGYMRNVGYIASLQQDTDLLDTKGK